MIGPYISPEFKPPPEPEPAGAATDFFSLLAAPPEPSELPEVGQPQKTDFASLRAGIPLQPEVILNNTGGDQLVNFITPALIFLMTNSAILFLLNVRFIYTSVLDFSLRFFAINFVLGIVALNRVIARKGSNESAIYIFGLFAAVFFYTITATGAYNVGSVGRNFLNDSLLAALCFNISIATGIWWMVNRLTHECCVDEEATAGDIGIFTATADKFRWGLQRAASVETEQPVKPVKAAEVDAPWYQINAFDPMEIHAAPAAPRKAAPLDYSARLPERHPGMSLFYFSIPVLLIFTLGLRVIQHAGMHAVRIGAFYMGIYTFCLLFLLSLTCLRQLRAYFAQRGVSMPANLSWLWMGASLAMILMMMWIGARLPMPALPPAVYVDEQQIDLYTQESKRIQLLDITPPTMTLMERYKILQHLDVAARLIMVVLLLYGAYKCLEYTLGYILKRKEDLPYTLAVLITAITWLLFKLWPALFRWAFAKRRIRIQRHVALSSRYDSPFRNPAAPPMPTRDHIIYAYDALRALATDIGAPPKASQTPYEFLENYPEGLRSMRDEAEEIIRLYVVAAYSDLEMTSRVEDRLRKFWYAFRASRNYYVR